MQNITNILNGYLMENVLTDYTIIYDDVFPEDENECICSRYDPSSAKETEFIDGSAVGAVQLSYYVRSNNADTARNTLGTIIENIDGLSCRDTDGIELRFEVSTLPNFISVDDKNNTVYCATIYCRYNRPAKEI